MISRREFLKYTVATGAGLVLVSKFGTVRRALAVPVDGGNLLDGESIQKFVSPLIIPPAMPRVTKIPQAKGDKQIDYYEIAVRQFQQQILPAGMPATTVWSYGSAAHPGTFNYPAFTIEAKWETPVRVKWINDLKDGSGNYLSHILPVDQTLHWANPPGGMMHRDDRGLDPTPYAGPVPLVTHVHGAHVTDESDGYAEAWFLPAAGNIPAGYAKEGTWYNTFKQQFADEKTIGHPSDSWAKGTATFQYGNDQRATTLWYHDHALGMTRCNVYAGPAGFYLLRGGPSDMVGGVLPGPAPALGDPPGMSYHEIPLAIQDRSFKTDGSLFYPNNRAYFEGLDDTNDLQIPFIPDIACEGQPSDISPIWNPEFFANTMVVNGRTWPYLDVEQRRYRFRILNGCNSRFLILRLSNGAPFWQIGTEGGFLPAPVMQTELLMGPAERADVIVDFGDVPAGTQVILQNIGPDEPFGGGEPDEDFEPANPETTGKVMAFNVVRRKGRDPSTPPAQLILPAIAPLPAPSVTRQLSLNELESATVRAFPDEDEGGEVTQIVLDCENPEAEAFGPRAAMLGTMQGGMPVPKEWIDAITENPAVGATEVWEIFNYTADAHPMHIHVVMFEVINRQAFDMETGTPTGSARAPEAWESGRKDTVIAYPGEVTRVKATFDLAGLFVWHCHIVEHEDNEMMRPYAIGTPPTPLP